MKGMIATVRGNFCPETDVSLLSTPPVPMGPEITSESFVVRAHAGKRKIKNKTDTLNIAVKCRVETTGLFWHMDSPPLFYFCLLEKNLVYGETNDYFYNRMIFFTIIWLKVVIVSISKYLH
jgi:hypothetical protein